MSLQSGAYLFLFLPALLVCCAVLPARFRGWCLLAFSLGFLGLLGGKAGLLYPAGVAALTYGTGLALERAQNKTARRLWWLGGVVLLLAGLIALKYAGTWAAAAGLGARFAWAVPLGLSFYTLEGLGYLTEVFWGHQAAERNFPRHLLFFTFFAKITEGPVCSVAELSDPLWRGDPLCPENLERGAVRILWGLFKKLVAADRLHYGVEALFASFPAVPLRGQALLAGALYTVQLYLDFSGGIDIVLGSARLLGVTLPENFRRPLFSEDAGEFWRRWHITLGRWFRTYVFYPVSVSRPVKAWNRFARQRWGRSAANAGAAFATLLPVWALTGLWHGPKGTYLAYGLYYFIILFVESLLEPGRKKRRKARGKADSRFLWRGLRVLRTLCVIVIGETLFRADSVGQFLALMRAVWLSPLVGSFAGGGIPGMGRADTVCALAAAAVVLAAELWEECRNRELYDGLQAAPLWVKWGAVLLLMALVAVFGRYGAGYKAVDFAYAGF